MVFTACTLKPLQQERDATVDLAGSEWVLQQLNNQSLVPDTNITLAFDEQNVDGFAGCNGYGGPYTVGKPGAITVIELAREMEACLEPQGVLEQEDAYITTLLSARSYRVEGDRLELLDDAGEVALTFARRISYAMEPAMLEDATWILQALGERTLIAGTHITIRFSQGKITGDAGCRA
jgi:heat shock protein HslJ